MLCNDKHSRANGDRHRVVVLFDEEPFRFESFDDLVSDVESSHTLKHKRDDRDRKRGDD